MRKDNNGYRPFKCIVNILEIFNLFLMIGAGIYVVAMIVAIIETHGAFVGYLFLGLLGFVVLLLLMKCALYFFDGCDYYAEEYLKHMRGRNNNDLLKK